MTTPAAMSQDRLQSVMLAWWPPAALLLAEETDARRRLGEQVPDSALDGEVDVGDLVPVALVGDRGRAPAPDQLGGDANGPVSDGQQSRKGCLGVPGHDASLPRR